jgi:sodium-coupled monocarboxylate transporter 8/12
MTTGYADETAVAGHSSLSVEELSNSLKTFGVLDYVVFAAMLVCCSGVGLYFGYQDHMKHKRSKRNRRGSLIEVEAIDYLMGGRNMKVFPVAMSLVASFVSGITLLGKIAVNPKCNPTWYDHFYSAGTSTEIYLYGTQYCYISIAIILSASIMHFTIIPVFHELQITSTYEVICLFRLTRDSHTHKHFVSHFFA